MEWLDSVWTWIVDLVKGVFQSIWEIVKDLGVLLLQTILDLFLAIIDMLDPPDFLDNGLDTYLAGIDPAVIYFLGQSGLGAGLSLIGLAVVFRLMRKILTLGQW